MEVASAGRRAAALLHDEREALAREVTAALYAERPELLDRYGERGREKCLQDMRYNLEHLEPAVDLGEPELFVDYVRWVDELLRARDVPTRELVRCLELTESLAQARLPAEAAERVVACVRAARRALERAAP